MLVEFAADGIDDVRSYPFDIGEDSSIFVLDWLPMIESIIAERNQGVEIGTIAARFQNSLAKMIVAVAKKVGQDKVALSGGCFQNRYLAEKTIGRLREAGFKSYWHQRVPPNDGGISLGQIIGATRQLTREK